MLTSLTSAHCLTNLSTLAAILYAYQTKEVLIKLNDTTFILGGVPMKHLLWCDKPKRAKRNKSAKINGITHTEIATK